MDKTIRVERPLSAYEMRLGKGVLLKLQHATPPVIKFLREKYLADPTCISGDIEFLFECKGEGLPSKYRYYKE